MPQSSQASNQQLAQLIAKQGIIPPNILDGMVNRARTLQEWLGQVIVEERLMSFDEIARLISRETHVPLVDLRTATPDPRALKRFPRDTCANIGLLPLEFDGRTLTLVMADPLDDAARTTIQGIARCELNISIAPLDTIKQAVDIWYSRLADQLAPGEVAADDYFPDMKSGGGYSPSQLPEEQDVNAVSMDELLLLMMENKASDLHLAVGSPPMMRVDGELVAMPFPVLKPDTIQTMIYSVLTDMQVTEFERQWELDFAYSLPRISRFRVNVHKQRNSVGAVLRTIPVDMPTLDKLKMPPIVHEMCDRPRGLVLVTGPTGSGKSTTLAAMIDEINSKKKLHIVTVEDPIEFLHSNKMSIITQREVGTDTLGFPEALRRVLRQDPDVILIGEMRDLETISAALTAAETGHLVFATLHTTSAAQTIDRIIDVFPPHQQEQVRSQLSNVLEAIFTQTLLPKIDGKGRVCAQEVLIATPAIRNLIREGKVHQMPSVLQASAKYGMQTLDQSLRDLVAARKCSMEEAILKASNPEDFKAYVAMG